MFENLEKNVAQAAAEHSIKNWSWEDCDLNRYFPIGNNEYVVRDGGTGEWRGIVTLTSMQVQALAA